MSKLFFLGGGGGGDTQLCYFSMLPQIWWWSFDAKYLADKVIIEAEMCVHDEWKQPHYFLHFEILFTIFLCVWDK